MGFPSPGLGFFPDWNSPRLFWIGKSLRIAGLAFLDWLQLPSSMTRESLVIRNPGYCRHGSNHKKSRPCFLTKSVTFGFGALSIGQICAESRDLGPEHGFTACSLKNGRSQTCLRDFPRFSRGLSEKPVNSSTNGWEPIIGSQIIARFGSFAHLLRTGLRAPRVRV